MNHPTEKQQQYIEECVAEGTQHREADYEMENEGVQAHAKLVRERTELVDVIEVGSGFNCLRAEHRRTVVDGRVLEELLLIGVQNSSKPPYSYRWELPLTWSLARQFVGQRSRLYRTVYAKWLAPKKDEDEA